MPYSVPPTAPPPLVSISQAEGAAYRASTEELDVQVASTAVDQPDSPSAIAPSAIAPRPEVTPPESLSPEYSAEHEATFLHDPANQAVVEASGLGDPLEVGVPVEQSVERSVRQAPTGEPFAPEVGVSDSLTLSTDLPHNTHQPTALPGDEVSSSPAPERSDPPPQAVEATAAPVASPPSAVSSHATFTPAAHSTQSAWRSPAATDVTDVGSPPQQPPRTLDIPGTLLNVAARPEPQNLSTLVSGTSFNLEPFTADESPQISAAPTSVLPPSSARNQWRWELLSNLQTQFQTEFDLNQSEFGRLSPLDLSTEVDPADVGLETDAAEQALNQAMGEPLIALNESLSEMFGGFAIYLQEAYSTDNLTELVADDSPQSSASTPQSGTEVPLELSQLEESDLEPPDVILDIPVIGPDSPNESIDAVDEEDELEDDIESDPRLDEADETLDGVEDEGDEALEEADDAGLDEAVDSLPEIPADGTSPTPPTVIEPDPTLEIEDGQEAIDIEVIPPEENPTGAGEPIELTADRQEYDEIRQVFIAEGNVEMLFRDSVLNADRLLVNLPNRIAVAEGNVSLQTENQLIQGQRIEYNFVQEEGQLQGARGEVFLSPPRRNEILPPPPTVQQTELEDPLSDRLAREQPPITVVPGGSVNVGIGGGGTSATGGGATGQIRRLRFEAENIDFTANGWEATNVRITNDPFSPPGLEVRTSRATYTRLSETRAELRARNPRLVFDQGLSIPLLRDRVIFDENDRNTALVQFGFDDEDRGGFYIERTFEPINNAIASFTITPQYFVQRAIDQGGNLLAANLFGLISDLDVAITPTTNLEGSLVITSLDLDDNLSDNLRASVRANQVVFQDHTLSAEYSFRNQLFNGSLGFEDVERSVGLVLESPTYLLGNTGISLSYDVGIQNVNANVNSDRLIELEEEGVLGISRANFNLAIQEATLELIETDLDAFIRLRDEEGLYDRNEDGSLRDEQGLVEGLIEEGVLDSDIDRDPRENNRATLTRFQATATLQRPIFLWVGQALPATPDEGLRYTPSPVVPFVALTPSIRGVLSLYSNGDSQPLLTTRLTLAGQFGNFSRPYLDYLGFNLSYSYTPDGPESPFQFDRLVDRQILSGGVTTQLFGPVRIGVQTSVNLEDNETISTDYILQYNRRAYTILFRFNPEREYGFLGLQINDFNWSGQTQPFSGSGGNSTLE